MARDWSALKDAMRQWQQPSEFREMVEAAHRAHGSILITDSDTKFWREAQNGADLALLLRAEGLRLGDDPPDVELRLAGDPNPKKIEVVEALPSSRKRDAEYKQDARIVHALRSGTPILPKDLERARLLYVPELRSDDEKRAALGLRGGRELTEQDRAALAPLFAGTPPKNLVWDIAETDCPGEQAVRESMVRNARNKAAKGYDRSYWLLIYLNPGFSSLSEDEIEALLATATEPARDAFAEVWVLWEKDAFQVWQAGRRGFRVLRGGSEG
ncbi:MAG TPA: hypothetical protein VGN83_22810 [Falsiroseomonas sp.]|jgi:hypothetical protein|nr:hypothetical protein [Falsiroseomonas sp.]